MRYSLQHFIATAGVIALAVAAAGCKPTVGASSSAAPASAAPSAASAAPAAATSSFQVVVTLSPAAAAQIARSQLQVSVMTTFYGDPTDQKLEDQYQGQDPLAPEEDVILQGSNGGTATVAIPPVDPAKAAAMRSGAEYGITVVSGNHVTENNTLNCDVLLDQPLAQAAGKTIPVKCKRIGES